MADIVHLSNTALAKITQELKAYNILKISKPPQKNDIGRRPIRLELNDGLGYIAVINLDKSFVRLFDFAGNIKYELTLPYVLVYDAEQLNNCLKLIKVFLKQNQINTLLAVTVITSGRTKPDGSFIYALRYKNPQQINLKKIFEEILQAPTLVKNDVSLALFSEYQNAEPKSSISVMMLYIDKGLGCAFTVGGKVIEGYRGFAGEVGLIKETSSGDILDNILSVRGLEKMFSSIGKNIKIDEITQSFIKKESQTVKIIEDYAQKLSALIVDLLLVLDCQKVLINGSIRCLKEDFLDMLRQQISKNRYLDAEILYSKEEDESSSKGGFLQAQDLVIKNIIKKS